MAMQPDETCMLIVYYITIISCYPSEKLEVVGGRF
jgi:hypothetical protein